LKGSFDKWYQYVAANRHLGIDSTTRRGNYSSFKKGIDSYFPFPDSLQVKMLFQKVVRIDGRTRQFIDSFKTIDVEGLFGSGRMARKESIRFYKGLRRELMTNYRYEYRDYFNSASWLYRGKSDAFPNCSIYHGYSEELKSYFVIISYSDQKNQTIKTYRPPDNTLRRGVSQEQ
jgi:hypothetical protein